MFRIRQWWYRSIRIMSIVRIESRCYRISYRLQVLRIYHMATRITDHIITSCFIAILGYLGYIVLIEAMACYCDCSIAIAVAVAVAVVLVVVVIGVFSELRGLQVVGGVEQVRLGVAGVSAGE